MHDRCLCLQVLIWMVILGELPAKLGYCPKEHLSSFTIKKSTKCRYMCQSHWSYGLWDWYASLVHDMGLRQKHRSISAKTGWTDWRIPPSMDGSARHVPRESGFIHVVSCHFPPIGKPHMLQRPRVFWSHNRENGLHHGERTKVLRNGMPFPVHLTEPEKVGGWFGLWNIHQVW